MESKNGLFINTDKLKTLPPDKEGDNRKEDTGE